MVTSSETLPEIRDEHLPALFVAADTTSVTSQRHYLRWVMADLSLLMAGALMSSFHLPLGIHWFSVASAILVGLSLITSFIIGGLRLERGWYGGRAAAESVKSLAWRYMGCAEPYGQALPPEKSDKKFLADLASILEQRRYLAFEVSGEASNHAQITERMRQVRAMATEERKKVYLSERIENQRTWYAAKAKRNQRETRVGFTVIITAQGLALTSAIILVAWPEIQLNWISVFAALAAAFLAWMQVKQYQELAQAYAIAAHELGLIIEQSVFVKNDDDLSVFIGDAENAISREHTLWVARRDKA